MIYANKFEVLTMKITITDLQNINLTYSETIALALLVKHLNFLAYAISNDEAYEINMLFVCTGWAG